MSSEPTKLKLLGEGLERHPDGYYTGRVANGSARALTVDNQYGSWMGTRAGGARCDVLPLVAAFLQEQLPKSERKSRR